jgi:hypothetical protein|tara:strand:+ start:97 stop:381 length:285 start_codon:yes stop_codon:yes gene_type:complete
MYWVIIAIVHGIIVGNTLPEVVVLDKKFASKIECKQSILDNGKEMQEEIFDIYPTTTQFSIVCVNTKQLNDIRYEYQLKRKNVSISEENMKWKY